QAQNGRRRCSSILAHRLLPGLQRRRSGARKLQISNPKLQRNPKSQASRDEAPLSLFLELRAWSFFGIWSFDIGIVAAATTPMRLAPTLQLRDVARACRGSDSAETRSLLQRLRWRCFKGSR